MTFSACGTSLFMYIMAFTVAYLQESNIPKLFEDVQGTTEDFSSTKRLSKPIDPTTFEDVQRIAESLRSDAAKTGQRVARIEWKMKAEKSDALFIPFHRDHQLRYGSASSPRIFRDVVTGGKIYELDGPLEPLTKDPPSVQNNFGFNRGVIADPAKRKPFCAKSLEHILLLTPEAEKTLTEFLKSAVAVYVYTSGSDPADIVLEMTTLVTDMHNRQRPAYTKVVLDSQRNYMIKRVQGKRGSGKDRDRVDYLVEVREWKLLPCGLHFPVLILSYTLAGGEIGEFTTRTTVKQPAGLRDEDFAFTFPEGTLVRNADTDEFYIWGKDGPARTFSSREEFSAWQRAQIEGSFRQRLFTGFVLGNGLLLALVTLAICWKWRQALRSRLRSIYSSLAGYWQ
ncbi:MAG: hypothetical protein C4297_00150 [Gemmataceae bacterium]